MRGEGVLKSAGEDAKTSSSQGVCLYESICGTAFVMVCDGVCSKLAWITAGLLSSPHFVSCARGCLDLDK